MAIFVGGFINCQGTKDGRTCGKLHTVDGAAMSGGKGCPSCGHDIKSQAWEQGRTQRDTTSPINW